MGRPLTRPFGSFCLLLALSLLPARSALASTSPDEVSARSLVTTHPPEQVVLSSASAHESDLSLAGTDSVYLLGGPRTEEGRFQSSGFIPDDQGWWRRDLTRRSVDWRVSDYNASNLGGHGAGNLAAWCGRETDDGFVRLPGYGNDWDDWMFFRSALTDPTVGQTISLDFVFNLDTEPDHDFFEVAYDSAGTWVTVLRMSGTNRDANDGFPAPGLRYSDLGADPIVYAGDDYGGPNGNEIVLRMRFVSDEAVSDEDGLATTVAGAVQVDDVSVVWSEGSSFEDFENAFGEWAPSLTPFAGEFSMVRPTFHDGGLDPCSENRTPMMTFIDAGQLQPDIICDAGIIPPAWCSTGGSLSSTWSYGFPGGWVVNYTDGVSESFEYPPDEPLALRNEVWSPEIEWDLAGTEDDGPDFVGAELRYSMWDHLIPDNGIAAVWHVRSRTDGGQWSPWRDRDVFYLGDGNSRWVRRHHDLTDLLVQDPAQIQVALGVWDVARDLGLPGDDATPAPLFDDVSVVKYRVEGPFISALRAHLAQSGFPPVGHLDVSTPSSRDALDVPFDMARDVSAGMAIEPGDSVVATVTPAVVGSAVDDVRMVWILEKNDFFEDALRAVPSRIVDENVVTGAERWSGEVVGQAVTDSGGETVPGEYFFDLPDVDFLYPGDVLRYHLQATDDGGRTNTLPADLAGFADGELYETRFVVRGLPSLRDGSWGHPKKLVIDLVERLDPRRPLLEYTFAELGFVNGFDYDLFRVPLAADALSNGIGSAGAHGATAAQLDGYESILVLGGSESGVLLSDGSGLSGNDRSDDLGLLDAWRQLPGDRNTLYLGDSLVSGLAGGGARGAAYVEDVMAVDLRGDDVRAEIGGETSPVVTPVSPFFLTRLAIYGACPERRRFDHILPLAGATVDHEFEDHMGNQYSSAAASILHDRTIDGDRKVDITLPFGLPATQSPMRKATTNTTARTELFREIFDYFGVVSGAGVVGAPPTVRPALEIHPNPFNPRTTLRFLDLPVGADLEVRVLNARGEHIASLHQGPYRGDGLVWNGTDDSGSPVASGVYFVEAHGGGLDEVRKVALVR